jgi:hypothetical protein
MQAHAAALLSKWITEELDDPETEWALLFKANLALMSWRNGQIMRKHGYSISDRILLDTISAYRKQHYTAGLWRAWLPLRFNLYLHPKKAVLPG